MEGGGISLVKPSFWDPTENYLLIINQVKHGKSIYDMRSRHEIL
jgi:hypothetical protein